MNALLRAALLVWSTMFDLAAVDDIATPRGETPMSLIVDDTAVADSATLSVTPGQYTIASPTDAPTLTVRRFHD